MLSLEAHHIVDLFVWIDNHLPKQRKHRGRPSALTDSELLTILLWDTVVLHHKTCRDLHTYARLHLRSEFPTIPTYNAFLFHSHRLLPRMWELLEELCEDAAIRLVDSTMLPVCKLHRADRHKVAKNIASFGKNHQGWHYGFKLHASVTLDGKLCEFYFTGASEYDAQVLPELINHRTHLVIGDTLYGASMMTEDIRKTIPDLIIVSPPWPSQKKKIIARWQKIALDWRSKIETVFDRLKEHLHLVSSFPRSIQGYLLHYVRILLGYQILALSC